MQLLEDTGLLPAIQASPAGLSGAEPQLWGQELPGYVVVEHVQDALQTQPVRYRLRARRLLRPGRQQRPDQCPQLVIHDPRPSTHTLPNSRIVTSVTPDQGTSTRSCYELIATGNGGISAGVDDQTPAMGGGMSPQRPAGPSAGCDHRHQNNSLHSRCASMTVLITTPLASPLKMQIAGAGA